MASIHIKKKYIVDIVLLILVIMLYELYCLKWSVKEFSESGEIIDSINISDAEGIFMDYQGGNAKITLFYNNGKVVTFVCVGDFYDLYGKQTNKLEVDDANITIKKGRIWQATLLEYLSIQYRFSKINHKNTPDNYFLMHDAYYHYIEYADESYNYTGDIGGKNQKQRIKSDNLDEVTMGEPVIFKLKNTFVKGEFRRFKNIFAVSKTYTTKGYTDIIDEEWVRDLYDV